MRFYQIQVIRENLSRLRSCFKLRPHDLRLRGGNGGNKTIEETEKQTLQEATQTWYSPGCAVFKKHIQERRAGRDMAFYNKALNHVGQGLDP